ncbi:tektin-B1-like [Hyalella azteca]|uniref:Tektin n=1 Tax=Hyalella azteca TaxID=294128 RepID=A0A979FPU7_HYAAZ|nr:tektin-B1-like [Hyalella azteca]
MSLLACHRKPATRSLEATWRRHNDAVQEAAAATEAAARHQHAVAAATRHELTCSAHVFSSRVQLTCSAHACLVQQVPAAGACLVQQVPVSHEERRLEQARAECLRGCDSRRPLLDVALHCVAVRETRRQGELLDDELERRLQEEVAALQRSRAALEKLQQELLQRGRRLEEVREALIRDLNEKKEALVVDSRSAEQLPQHSDVSFKPAPQQGASHPLHALVGHSMEAWRKRSEDKMMDAATAVRMSQEARAAACVEVQRCDAEDDHCRRATNFELRRRRHDTDTATAALKWRRQCLLRTAATTESEIEHLERELASTQLLVKAAQTRLEDRKARPANEATADAAQESLWQEERQLRRSRDALRGELAASRMSLHEVQEQLRAVDRELRLKATTAGSEQTVAGLREVPSRLPSKEGLVEHEEVASLTLQNLQLTGSLQQHATLMLT